MSDVSYEIGWSVEAQDVALLELLIEVLLNQGVDMSQIIQYREGSEVRLSLIIECHDEVSRLKKSLERVNSEKISFFEVEHHRESWENKWKDQWGVFALTDNLDIVPAWKKDEYQAGNRKFLLLDTVGAFGTGLHETTRFMTEFVERYIPSGCSFFDIGTGTGILAAVALLNGAQEVYGIDISDLSVKTAKENFLRNGLSFANIEAFDLEIYALQKEFDFVAANLITHDLIRLAEKILSFVSSKGLLALSGVSLDNLAKVKEKFNSLGLTLIEESLGESWAALLYRKE